MAIAKAKPAPNFSLSLTDGTSFELDHRIGYSPLLLYFFKTSCPVCQYTSPFLERLSSSGVQVYGICQDLDENRVHHYQSAFHKSIPIMQEQTDYYVSNTYQIDVVPTLLLVSADGIIQEAVESFDRSGIENIASKMKIPSPFHAGDNVPQYRPG